MYSEGGGEGGSCSLCRRQEHSRLRPAPSSAETAPGSGGGCQCLTRGCRGITARIDWLAGCSPEENHFDPDTLATSVGFASRLLSAYLGINPIYIVATAPWKPPTRMPCQAPSDKAAFLVPVTPCLYNAARQQCIRDVSKTRRRIHRHLDQQEGFDIDH